MRWLFASVASFALCSSLCAAAELAHPGFDLGRQYRHGSGVARDSVKAFRLIESAAVGGHAPAMFIVSGMLAAGEGVARDDALARRWLEAAADADYPEALQQLAMHLKDGAAGFERDERRAAQLMAKAGHALKHRAYHGH